MLLRLLCWLYSPAGAGGLLPAGVDAHQAHSLHLCAPQCLTVVFVNRSTSAGLLNLWGKLLGVTAHTLWHLMALQDVVGSPAFFRAGHVSSV